MINKTADKLKAKYVDPYVKRVTNIDTTEVAGVVQGLGLNALTRFAASDIPDQLGVRKTIESFLYEGSKAGFGFMSAKMGGKSDGEKKELTEEQIAKKKKGLFDLSLTDDQQMMRDTLRAFSKEAIYPAAHDADHNHATPDELLGMLGELGLAYNAVPEEFGGMAASDATISQMLNFEDLGYGDFGIALAALSNVSVANVINRYGTAVQKQKYLPQFVSETSLQASLATNERTPLFNPRKLKTTVKGKGNVLTLNGEKNLVIMADKAKVFVVSAMYNGKPELFLVDANAKGVKIKDEPAMGMKPAATKRVIFNDVHLLDNAKLNVNYTEFLDLSRMAVCAVACGTGDAVLEYVKTYVNEREAFGEPISHRQSVAFMVADIAIEVEAMRMMVWRAVSRAQNGLPFHREAHLAYVLCADKTMQIGTDGVQLVGGHGYTKEHPVERWYRDLRSVGVLHGSLCL